MLHVAADASTVHNILSATAHLKAVRQWVITVVEIEDRQARARPQDSRQLRESLSHVSDVPEQHPTVVIIDACGENSAVPHRVVHMPCSSASQTRLIHELSLGQNVAVISSREAAMGDEHMLHDSTRLPEAVADGGRIEAVVCKREVERVALHPPHFRSGLPPVTTSWPCNLRLLRRASSTRNACPVCLPAKTPVYESTVVWCWPDSSIT